MSQLWKNKNVPNHQSALDVRARHSVSKHSNWIIIHFSKPCSMFDPCDIERTTILDVLDVVDVRDVFDVRKASLKSS